jgi:hypothetical protein
VRNHGTLRLRLIASGLACAASVGCSHVSAPATPQAAEAAGSPVPSVPSAPVAAPAASLEAPSSCEHVSGRGFERVREISRTENTSLLLVETNYFGGAMGGSVFGWSCISDLCRARDCSAFVILEHHIVRTGTLKTPGNDWQLTVGFLKDSSGGLAASFPDFPEAARTARVWPVLDTSRQRDVPEFFGSVYPSELWDVFSSIHYRYRAPGEVDEPPDQATLDAKADKAARALQEERDGNGRLYALARAGQAALEAGRIESAEGWAVEMLELAGHHPGTGGAGTALHQGHLILGRIALGRGDVDGAKARLLKAGMTPGSPTLGSFGPSMRLAQDLLEKGEREVVLEYFGLCRAFWIHGAEDLDAWTAEVEAGRIPDFGANLVY